MTAAAKHSGSDGNLPAIKVMLFPAGLLPRIINRFVPGIGLLVTVQPVKVMFIGELVSFLASVMKSPVSLVPSRNTCSVSMYKGFVARRKITAARANEFAGKVIVD